MRKGGVNKEVKTTDNKRNEKLPFFTQLLLDTPYMECYSQWNHKCQPGLRFVFQKSGCRGEDGLPQSRTHASSRYPSYKRRLGTECEFSPQA